MLETRYLVSYNLPAMRVLGFLPLLFFCAVAVRLRGAQPLRDGAIISGVVTGVWIVAGCELLSLLHAVTFWPVLIWWTIPTVALAWKCRRWRPAGDLPSDWFLLTIVAATMLVLGIVFVQAALMPPNNWDALSYHLPRQVYWMQQGHVGLFPASDPRTVLMPPFSEYAGLHLMILSGGDHWANLVQWFALALTGLTASAIARELGCNDRLQALAALLVVTIPTAALQGANPKNDVVTAFYLCVFAFAGLKAYNARQFSAPLIGAAGGLLILSKGTGLIYGLPVVLWIGAACIRARGLKRALPWGAATALIAFTINAAFVFRITTAFGSPLGPPVGEGAPPVANTLFTPPAFASNLLRNTAMHLATGMRRVDSASTRLVTGLHGALGIETNDPRTTFMKGAPFQVTPDFFDENRAKAPVHMALAILASVVTVIGLFRDGDKWIASFLLLPFLCFALFCFLMAWQEWHSRLHIPLFCLAAAVIARTLRPIALPCGFLAVALALACVIHSEAKPLLHPRRAGNRFKTSETITGLAEASRSIRERRPAVLGIVSQPNRCEYFLLSTLITAVPAPPRFVKVNNRFPQIAAPYTNFDLVISWHNPTALTNADFQSTYRLISEAGVVAVFDRK